MTYRHIGTLLVLAAFAGCEEKPTKIGKPPPAPAKPATCKGERKANDPANLKHFPETAGSYCLDPAGSDKAYGEGAKHPLDGICSLFDGECEVYLSGGVKHVVQARYVDGSGSAATIDVYLSKYKSTQAAYAMFTKRVVGDLDPAHEDTAKPGKGGGAAALGTGNAYVWRGIHLAEITYNDQTANTVEDIRKRSGMLPSLVTAFGEKLPGDLTLPPTAAALPKDKRLPMGIRFLNDKLLDVEGTGPGALGYYKDGDKRWRVVSIKKGDVDQAKDVWKTFAKRKGAAAEKGLGDAATRFMLEPAGLPKTEWIIVRKGDWVIGIGDEDRVLREGISPDEYHALSLSQDKKRELLTSLLTPAPRGGR